MAETYSTARRDGPFYNLMPNNASTAVVTVRGAWLS